MVELGLLRAQAAGYAVPFDLEELDAVAWRELEAGELTPGDIGLMLWIDARRDGGRGAELADRLDGALARNGGLGARLGMELGWIVTGLAHHVAAGGSQTGVRLLSEALDQLLVDNRAPTALFRHFGDAGWRRRFPNFATQIYSVLALAVVARHGLDDRALPAAIATADRLLEMQLPDGGWPWLFDAERGTVVERYEIYSVHQDAMAPMALLELWEVCREPRFTDAVARSLAWIHGDNELGVDMVDRANGLVLRSIRRKPGHDRLWAGAKTAASLAGLSTRGATGASDRDQPNRPPVSLRLGARGLVRTRGRSRPRTGARGRAERDGSNPCRSRSRRDRRAPARSGALPAGPATVDVVVVAYNSSDTLRACVEPLARLPWVDVIVVDNACPEDSSRVVEDLPVRIVRSPRNGGFAYGCNLGMANGSAEFVLLLNPDAEIDAASLAILGRRAPRGSIARGVGPRIVDDAGNSGLHPTPVPPPALHLRARPVPASGGARRGLGR